MLRSPSGGSLASRRKQNPDGLVELCAVAPILRTRYTVIAPRNQLRSQALALRELIVAYGLASIETPFVNARWLRPNGSSVDCADVQLIVTLWQLRLAAYPEAGLFGRVVTEAIAIGSPEDDGAVSSTSSPKLAYDQEAVLARVSAGLSTVADAQALRMRLSPPADTSRDVRN